MTAFKRTLSALAVSACLMPAAATHAGEVEVLHWWTAGGEARAAAALKEMMEEQGHTWKDFAVAGGGGEAAMTVLKTRAVSGNPPAAAQIKGLDIREWAKLGFLTSLDDVAAAEGWDDLVPPMISSVMQYEGEYVAVPVNVHRVNWLWVNPDVMEKVGVDVPNTLDEFFTVADKLKAEGYIPLAHGGQPWQDATVFEAVALAVMDSDTYRKALVEHDMDVIDSAVMEEVFTKFAKVMSYVDDNAAGRDWNTATGMVIRGEAAMQIMGDWAKGEFTAAGLTPGEDYLCAAAPGTAGEFTFNVDSFAMFGLSEEEDVAAQKDLARTILEPKFQTVFNQNKGSIPVRTDMDMSEFDACAQASMETFKSSADTGELVPSLAHGLATTSYVQGQVFDVVTNFVNSSDKDPVKATDQLAAAIQAAK